MNVLLVLLPVIVAATIGQGLAHSWQNARQAREQDLATAAQLYRLYGRFFGIWKHWRAAMKNPPVAGDELGRLLAAATEAEGEMEALLVRLASERCLETGEINRLGALRQAYQTLRESIEGPEREHRRKSVADWRCSWHPEYIAMKALATDAANLAATPRGE